MADFVSQGKIFVDISGPAAVSRQLMTAKSLDIKDGRSTEVVLAIGVSGGAGFRNKEGGFELDLTVTRTVGKAPEVDWYMVKRSRSNVTLTTQDEDNGRRQSYTARVSKIDTKIDESGVHEDTITLVATQANDR